MGKITGSWSSTASTGGYRPVDERVKHWREFVEPLPKEEVKTQAARCMDCGIPYCHNGCPVNNQIPDWNDLVYRDQWKTAARNLHSTNNFPEVTGRVCPAPCEASCTLNIDDKPVTIKTIECAIADKALRGRLGRAGAAGVEDRQEGRHRRLGTCGARRRPAARARRPRGARLREERQARRAAGLRHPRFQDGEGHRRSAREADGGGRRRLPLQRSCRQGRCRARSSRPRTTPCCWPAAPRSRSISLPSRPGATSTASTSPWTSCRSRTGASSGEPQRDEPQITAKDKHVIVIGGGDTGSDCIGTSFRQGAKSVTQLEIMPMPPEKENKALSWPHWPLEAARLLEPGRRRQRRVLDLHHRLCRLERQGREAALHARRQGAEAGAGERRRAAGRSGAIRHGLLRGQWSAMW